MEIFRAVLVIEAFQLRSNARLVHTLHERMGLEGYFIATLSVGTLGSVDGSLASLSGEAERPAALAASALLVAVLEGRDALGVLHAVSVLSGALLLDAGDRVTQGYDFLLFFDGFLAVVGGCALGEVNSGLVVLLSEAELPTGFFGAALVLAFLEDSGAL